MGSFRLNPHETRDDFWDGIILRAAVKEFMDILDETEESDSGTVFKPTQISCCRAHLLTKIDNLLGTMRRLTRD